MLARGFVVNENSTARERAVSPFQNVQPSYAEPEPAVAPVKKQQPPPPSHAKSKSGKGKGKGSKAKAAGGSGAELVVAASEGLEEDAQVVVCAACWCRVGL